MRFLTICTLIFLELTSSDNEDAQNEVTNYQTQKGACQHKSSSYYPPGCNLISGIRSFNYQAVARESINLNGSTMEASSPPSKRQRLDASKDADPASASGDDDEDLMNLMDGDDFVTEEQQQESDAKRRRLLRKQRLERAQQADDSPAAIKVEDGAPVASEAQNGTADSNKQSNQGGVKLTGAEEKMSGGHPSATDPNASEDDDADAFDMFSSSVSPVQETSTKAAAAGAKKRGQGQGDWDDVEGYYKAVSGEVISLESTVASTDHHQSALTSSASTSFRVMGMVGKGVFSTVLKCSTLSNSTSAEVPPVVAIKSIRHNETMAKAAENEILTLLRLNGSPGIVPLLLPTTPTPLEHRGHIMLVFPFMEYNLRGVQQKFGKGVGISLVAVRSYFAQLLAAATHLKKHGIIHADCKPDNILVSADFGVVQLADFGSAVHVDSPEQNQPTPYLISRFYRAPEVILGLVPTFAVDLWSIAVTVAEIFVGQVLFRGKSNNDMLYCIMQHLGSFSNRIIRQHLVQCRRLPIPRHFQQEGANYMFMQQTADPVTGQPVHKMLSLLARNNDNKFPMGTPLNQQLLKAKSGKDSRTMINRFSDLLQKCLALDPTRRIALKDALQHEFFRATETATTHAT